jgi:hypothetical protein
MTEQPVYWVGYAASNFSGSAKILKLLQSQDFPQ